MSVRGSTEGQIGPLSGAPQEGKPIRAEDKKVDVLREKIKTQEGGEITRPIVSYKWKILDDTSNWRKNLLKIPGSKWLISKFDKRINSERECIEAKIEKANDFELQSAVRLGSPKAALELGKRALAKGEKRDAEVYLVRAKELDPKGVPQKLLELGRSALKDELYARAKEYFSLATKFGVPTTFSDFFFGLTFPKAEELDNYINYFKSLGGPLAIDLLTKLGDLCLDNKAIQNKAFLCFNEAIRYYRFAEDSQLQDAIMRKSPEAAFEMGKRFLGRVLVKDREDQAKSYFLLAKIFSESSTQSSTEMQAQITKAYNDKLLLIQADVDQRFNACKTEENKVAVRENLKTLGNACLIDPNPEIRKNAFKCFQELGDTCGHELGLCYEKGIGVKADLEKAISYYEKVREDAPRVAQYYLSKLEEEVDKKKACQAFLNVIHGQPDFFLKEPPATKVKIFKLAEQGSKEPGNRAAVDLLAHCYDTGFGVDKNVFEAGRLRSLY